ncbi:MAG: hypothetical protein JF609_05040 [Verrucomicrobia bacterium]|nr:hypothetical protein [Verrucomicrobiota bacterium]
MVRQFCRSDWLVAKDLFGEIFHATIGRFITFMMAGFLHRKQQPFYMLFGTGIILHSLQA